MYSVNNTRPDVKARLSQRCEQRGVNLNDSQLTQLADYLALLLQWQRHLNLTGLRELDAMIEVLVLDSLDFLAGNVLPRSTRMLDVGTGAGVPGIALAICEPSLQVTLLDRSQKKITFLRRVVAQLQLPHCQPEAASAEEFARRLTPEPGFDAVVTRGVGTVAHLLSLTAPLLRPGGALILRKPLDTSELEEAESQLATETWKAVDTVRLPSVTASDWMLIRFIRGCDRER